LAVDFVDEPLQGISALKDEFDDGRVDDQAVLAREIEEGLEDVGEAVDGDEVEEAGATLEGVEGSEDGVEGFGVLGLAFEDEDTLLNIVEVLARFRDELSEKVAVACDIQDDGEAGFIRSGFGRGGGKGSGRWGVCKHECDGIAGLSMTAQFVEKSVEPVDVFGREGETGFHSLDHAGPSLGAILSEPGQFGDWSRNVA